MSAAAASFCLLDLFAIGYLAGAPASPPRAIRVSRLLVPVRAEAEPSVAKVPQTGGQKRSPNWPESKLRIRLQPPVSGGEASSINEVRARAVYAVWMAQRYGFQAAETLSCPIAFWERVLVRALFPTDHLFRSGHGVATTCGWPCCIDHPTAE